MYAQRPPEERIDRYAGPYERWVFSEELGRPYAFPAIRQPEARHMAAILEGDGDPSQMKDAETRLPPLWPPQAAGHAVTPFVFRNDNEVDLSPDRALAKRLGTLTAPDLSPRVRLNMPLDAASWVETYAPETPAAQWRRPARTPKAILGVIDNGLPFAHRAFLDTNGKTRISHLWLQSARALPSDRVPVGREITNGEIDALRTAHGADERRLYRSVGAIDGDMPEVGRLLDHHATHGGHILGLAGGNGARLPGPELGDDIQIVAVQLPNTVAWDTSGFGKEMFMLSALHYIFARASEIARDCGVAGELPLVVNFSYGWSAGRHDGRSEMEAAIQQMLARRRQVQPETAVVMPTGNTFDSDMHARVAASDFEEGTARVGWRLLPDDRTSSYLEIWLPEEFDPQGWQVRLIPPPGSGPLTGTAIDISADPELDPVGDLRRFVELERDGHNLGQLSVDFHRGSRWRVIVAMIPTAETGTDRRLPSGLWTIEIARGHGTPIGESEALYLWLQRDDDPRALGMGGRQSHLEGASGMVRGFGCLSAICSAPDATRVAGLQGGTGQPAAYSSGGGLDRLSGNPVAWGAQPDFAALSDQGPSRPGLPSLGTISGSGARLVGTSAAAALASRWMVSNAASGKALQDGLAPLPLLPPGDARILRAARLGRGRVPIEL
ncbi:hypothetical protein [Aliiruegeria lutimaris]|uniref:Subtilase family protein n=1 Tax=Aliiruegeria lutimaris TaxID=571298 RepID=A0A1G8RPK7_9RHOB|nr:hypothetical protein [Aliiruegeria lutimaris]SDJ18833.1 hypothetical protein SAMN04488026_101375 [Aliiruegeria lutimaris]